MVTPINNTQNTQGTKVQAVSVAQTDKTRTIIVGQGKVQPVTNKCYFGAWLGATPDEDDNNLITSQSLKLFRQKQTDFAALTGKKPSIVMKYQPWSDSKEFKDFPSTFANEVLKNKQIPMITWEPTGLPFDVLENTTYLDEFNKQFDKKEGQIYEYAKKWAKQAKSFGKPFFVRPFHEMNLQDNYPWTAWLNGNAAGTEKFKVAWRNLYNLFKEVGANNATFVWCPNNESLPPQKWNNITNYFPGDEYVDWIGVDGYRKNSAQKTVNDVFGAAMRELKALAEKYKKPLIICEVSSFPDAGKGDFVKSLFDAANNKELQGIIWFNENKKALGGDEDNWLIDAKIPNLTKTETVNAELEALIKQGKDAGYSPAQIEDLKKEYYRSNGIKPPSPQDLNQDNVNPVLDVVRQKNSNLVYEEITPTLNTQGLNQESKQIIILPKRMREVQERTEKITKYQTTWRSVAFPIHKQNGDLSINNAAYIDELSGYQAYLAKPDEDRTALIDLQRKKAVAELLTIKYTDRRYLLAMSKLKDIYAVWKGFGNTDTEAIVDRDKKLQEAFNICIKILDLTADRGTYLKRFDNKVLSIPILFGAFDWLDITRFSKSEIMGFRASAYATMADLDLAGNMDDPITEARLKTAQQVGYDIKSGTTLRDLIKWEYSTAKELLDQKRWYAKVADSAVEFMGTDSVLGYKIVHDVDIAISINIGEAILKIYDTAHPEKMEEGIRTLESIAYKKGDLSQRQKLRAKVELASALAQYNYMAEKLPADSPERDKYIAKAKKSLVVARELFGTEYGFDAAKLMTELSQMVNERKSK